jgi:hypothetical protein
MELSFATIYRSSSIEVSYVATSGQGPLQVDVAVISGSQ